MALSMCEAGGFVYAIDVHAVPSSDFEACQVAAKKFGTKLVYIQGDATNPARLAEIFGAIKAEHNRLDVMVAAAGILGELLTDSWGVFTH